MTSGGVELDRAAMILSVSLGAFTSSPWAYNGKIFCLSEDGDTVQVAVEDNGAGMSAEQVSRIFEPFFTTKSDRGGTGLGLSISHDIIVKQHCGSIEVDTAPGEYTEFRIVLPRKAATLEK